MSSQEIEIYVATLKRALQKLPIHKGIVYRYISLQLETLNQYIVGARVLYQAPTSTMLPDGLRDFKGSSNHEFEIESLEGRLIEHYSYNPEENFISTKLFVSLRSPKNPDDVTNL